MGGKTWSVEEEKYFWTAVIPRSPKAVKVEQRELDWHQCAKMMQKGMGRGSRREYNHNLLFEHYFQNMKVGHRSPKAGRFVQQHKQDIEAETERRKLAGEPLDDRARSRPVKRTARRAKKAKSRRARAEESPPRTAAPPAVLAPITAPAAKEVPDTGRMVPSATFYRQPSFEQTVRLPQTASPSEVPSLRASSISSASMGDIEGQDMEPFAQNYSFAPAVFAPYMLAPAECSARMLPMGYRQ
ncbi:hypothetical protein B0I35DRAFT_512026 [Stachybotrys elegans]|uniref:Uncharacterized protein n=1 Tax=Stachybotrys elegans TaxID=80388 RepID=A0A8K0WRU1_9HYPO|nr:hypothetical protein B0I35DRAFT_512026 [Stachybotrys elegans]